MRPCKSGLEGAFEYLRSLSLSLSCIHSFVHSLLECTVMYITTYLSICHLSSSIAIQLYRVSFSPLYPIC